MELDTNLLLTAEKLYLDPGLVQGKNVEGTFALKRPASQTYLVVDPLQHAVLQEFTQRRSVPEVLEACIRKRCCPALREFYDLVLKAHQAGVLRSEELGAEGPAQITCSSVRWFGSLPAGPAAVSSWIAGLAAVAVFVLRPPSLPGNVLDVLIGWAAACAAMSLGQVLAASVLRHGDGEVYRPHLRWLSWVPHFAVDLSDVCMTDRWTRIAAHSVKLLPLAATAAAGLWLRTPWSLVPLVGLLLASCPIGAGPVASCLALLRRRPLLATDDSPVFEAPMTFAEHCQAAWQLFDVRAAALQVGAAISWSAGLGFTAYRFLHLDPQRALLDASIWWTTLAIMGVAFVLIVLWWMANIIQYNIEDAVVSTWQRVRLRCRRWRSTERLLNECDDVEMLIRRNPLLRRLDPEKQAELAEHAQSFTAGAWKTLCGFGDVPQFVGLIVSGTARINCRHSSGRKMHFLSVIEGDLIGAHRLVGDDVARLEIRTGTPFCALVFEREIFKRLVVDTLGAATVRNYVYKHLFLQRGSPICADWRPAAVARFAELASTTTHAAGGKIITRGEEVGNLFVLYQGRARALQGKKRVGRIEPGDFFGEVSLLQTTPATADVESNEDSHSLVVNRIEFIRFMSKNHHVALQMERLCSKRLGRPVFPCRGDVFG